MTSVVALVPDLMDRARIEAAAGDRVRFVSSVEELGDPDVDVVIVDLTRVPQPAEIRRAAPRARIVGFGPHVDGEVFDTARAAGIDDVMPRSMFFRTVDELLG
jgi:hypothetical protein